MKRQEQQRGEKGKRGDVREEKNRRKVQTHLFYYKIGNREDKRRVEKCREKRRKIKDETKEREERRGEKRRGKGIVKKEQSKEK